MIRLREKMAYGFGDMASSMFWKIFGMYLLFFYTKVFGITPAAAGTLFIVTRLWDAVNDPMMGLIADRTHTRWGKYRPYLLWFALPFTVIGIMTFHTPDLGESGKLVYAYLTYTLMMMVYTVVNVPYASLLGTISPVPAERNTLSSYRMFFAYIGSFLTFVLLQPLIDGFARLFSGGAPVDGTAAVSTDPAAWTAAVAVIGILCTGLFLLCFAWTRERVVPVGGGPDAPGASVKRDIADLFHAGPWWILLVAGIAALLFNSIRDGVTLFYFADYVCDDYKLPGAGFSLGTLYLLVGQAANMAGVALAAPISNRFGKKRTYIGAMLLAAPLSMIFYGFGPGQTAWIFLFQALISLCAGIIFPLLWSMYADIVDYQELKTGRRTTGLIFSSSSMSQKFGWALGGALTGWLLTLFGYDPEAGVQSASALTGIRLMMSWLPAAGCLLAVAAISFYPLSEPRVREIVAALNKRRKSHENRD